MHSRGKPTRLELHRLKYNQGGRRGPLLRLVDLEDQEKDLINREVLKDVRVKNIDFTKDGDEQIFDDVQVGVLAEYGIMCPHPELERPPPGFSSKKGYECTVCGCVVFPYRWREELRLKLGQKD